MRKDQREKTRFFQTSGRWYIKRSTTRSDSSWTFQALLLPEEYATVQVIKSCWDLGSPWLFNFKISLHHIIFRPPAVKFLCVQYPRTMSVSTYSNYCYLKQETKYFLKLVLALFCFLTVAIFCKACLSLNLPNTLPIPNAIPVLFTGILLCTLYLQMMKVFMTV